MALTPEKIKAMDAVLGVDTLKTLGSRPAQNRKAELQAIADRSLGFSGRAKKAMNQGVADYQNIISGKGEPVPEEGQENTMVTTRRALQGTASAFSTPIKFALKEAYKKLPKVTQEGLSDLGNKVGEKMQQAGSVLAEIPGYQDWASSNERSAKDLEELLKSYSAAGEISGDILSYNQAAQTGKAVANEAGRAIEGTGNALKGAANKLYEHAITPNTPEAEEILKYRANTPFFQRVKNTITGEGPKPPQTRASTAAEQGIYGTEGQVGVKARRISDKLWNDEIQPALNDSKAVMSKDQLFNTAVKRISETVEPAKRQAYMDAFEALQDEYKDMNYIPANNVQKIKSSLDKFTPEKVWRGKPIANEYATLRADMANDARNFIYDTVGDNIKPKYIDWSNLHDLQEVGVKAISNAGLQGGAGKFMTSLWNTASTPIKTIGGQVLYRVGDALEFLAPKGVKTLGDFLSAKGFIAPANLGLQGSDSGANTPQNKPQNKNNLNHGTSIAQPPNSVNNDSANAFSALKLGATPEGDLQMKYDGPARPDLSKFTEGLLSNRAGEGPEITQLRKTGGETLDIKSPKEMAKEAPGFMEDIKGDKTEKYYDAERKKIDDFMAKYLSLKKKKESGTDEWSIQEGEDDSFNKIPLKGNPIDEKVLRSKLDSLIDSRISPKYTEFIKNIPIGSGGLMGKAVGGTSSKNGIRIATPRGTQLKDPKIIKQWENSIIHEYAHEYLYYRDQKDPEFLANFLEDFQKLTNAQSATGYAKFDTEFAVSALGGAVEPNIKKRGHSAHEAYAYGAGVAAEQGLKAIPEPLRKYYDWLK